MRMPRLLRVSTAIVYCCGNVASWRIFVYPGATDRVDQLRPLRDPERHEQGDEDGTRPLA